MEQFIGIAAAAALVESLMELIKDIKDKEMTWIGWLVLIMSIGASVLVTYNWNLDLFTAVLGEGQIPYLGAILTGFIVARGSKVVHDLWRSLEGLKGKLNTP